MYTLQVKFDCCILFSGIFKLRVQVNSNFNLFTEQGGTKVTRTAGTGTATEDTRMTLT